MICGALLYRTALCTPGPAERVGPKHPAQLPRAAATLQRHEGGLAAEGAALVREPRERARQRLHKEAAPAGRGRRGVGARAGRDTGRARACTNTCAMLSR